MISTVIPVYNEAESLAQLHSELSAVAAENQLKMEFIFVDDGSSDDSWKEICRLAEGDDRISGIRFRRNFGKAAALNAGFERAQGDIVFTLDADLQDDPAEIPNFLAKMEQDLDVVSGWKQVRHDPWHKTMPSKVFNALVSFLTGVKLNDHNCGFKCYRREIFDEVYLYGELHRFVPVLANARGWKVGELPVQHRARQHGVSKYGFRRFVKGFLDLLTVYFLTGFRNRPQHLLGTLGVLSFCAGFLGLGYLVAYWCVNTFGQLGWDPLHQRPALHFSILALLLGANFITAGFLAELLTAYYGRSVVPYSVKETFNRPDAAAKQQSDLAEDGPAVVDSPLPMNPDEA